MKAAVLMCVYQVCVCEHVHETNCGEPCAKPMKATALMCAYN